MFELKPLSEGAIPAALAKVERYRLLNEPALAESICLDILRIEPDHQQALVMLILSVTDQFDEGRSPGDARELLSRLEGAYERAYYTGLIRERHARALMRHSRPGSHYSAYQAFRDAMSWYEKAEVIRPPGNDDALLRWNTCARLLERNPHLQPAAEEQVEPILSE
jgi:hypothetical protein